MDWYFETILKERPLLSKVICALTIIIFTVNLIDDISTNIDSLTIDEPYQNAFTVGIRLDFQKLMWLGLNLYLSY